MSAWEARCVLCSARGRDRRLEAGHCCPACSQGLTDALRAILRLCELASAAIVPASSGDTGRGGYESRPAANLAAVDPELTLMPMFDGDNVGTTILDMLESAERAIREDRGWLPYGPASAMRSGAGTATLTGVIGFLEGQVPWITTTPDFGLEDFSWQVHRAAGILAHWDPEHERGRLWEVECPADVEDGTCGRMLKVSGDDLGATVRCRDCGTGWTVDRLMLVVADTTDARMWLDADALCRRTGVDVKTLQRWVREGRVERAHGLYDARPIVAATRRLGA